MSVFLADGRSACVRALDIGGFLECTATMRASYGVAQPGKTGDSAAPMSDPIRARVKTFPPVLSEWLCTLFLFKLLGIMSEVGRSTNAGWWFLVPVRASFETAGQQ